METRFVPRCRKTHRIGNRLIDAGDAEPSGGSAIGLARKRDGIAYAKPFRSRQLPRDEDCGGFLALRGGDWYGPPGNRPPHRERE
jgi:hypothetical protein